MDGRVLVTGAGGVVGSALAELLGQDGPDCLFLRSRSDCDLEDFKATSKLFHDYKPTHVFHLAGAVYGVGGNLSFPGDIFRRNTMINTHVVEAARLVNASKIVAMGTVAMYSDEAPLPAREDDVLVGTVHSSEAYYAAAKRGLLYQLDSYQKQFGTKFCVALSTNLYGPNDRFDEKFGHVVPSLVRRFAEASRSGSAVTVWGDGSPTRDFLFSRDAARGLVMMMERGSGVYNLASGRSVRIRDLVETLSALLPEVSYSWDPEKPMGQMRRAYDIGRISELGFVAGTDLRSGLKETLDWYRSSTGKLRT